jgi:hypothetical protein
MDDAALSGWLRLREQRDWRARSGGLTQAIVATLPHDRPVGVLDLASGAGSNLRYLAERLPMHQRWLLIDRSATLVSEVESRTMAWAAARGYAVNLSARQEMGFSSEASAEAPRKSSRSQVLTSTAMSRCECKTSALWMNRLCLPDDISSPRRPCSTSCQKRGCADWRHAVARPERPRSSPSRTTGASRAILPNPRTNVCARS